jgi:hypothetical protein
MVYSNEVETSYRVFIFKMKRATSKNDYRFMNAEIINEKLKTVKFKGVKWDVEIEPSLAGVQRFNFQATANTEHSTFVVRTEARQTHIHIW